MKVLVINCGSSSLKYQLFDMADQSVLAKGLVERIGIEGSVLTHRRGEEKTVITQAMSNHDEAISLVLAALTNPEYGVISNLQEINAVGHRVLHGAEKFTESVLIDDEVMEAVHECIELGPLHNPANIMGIEACQKLMPGVPQVAVFDTAFHQSMPAESYIYGLPYEMYEKHRIRRYGFHGTSHKYVSMRAIEMLGKPAAETKVITCHLGNGASVAAVKGGKCVDTSMGLTPLEGLIMGTRSGDIDPAIVQQLMKKENLSIEQVDSLLNKKSGVLGISGVSSDFRDIGDAAAQGNYRAKLALDIYANKVKKYIGSYAAVLGGVDAIVFTAGLGENSASMRQSIVSGLEFLGVDINLNLNDDVHGKEVDISKPEARCRVLVIPTNEELMIALDTAEIAG